jgi:hypothetical protein
LRQIDDGGITSMMPAGAGAPSMSDTGTFRIDFDIENPARP